MEKTRLRRRLLSKVPGPLRSRAFRVILLLERMLSLFRRRQFSHPESVLDCVVSYNAFGAYCVPRSSRHRPAAQKILARNVHEPDTLAFMIENCADGDIVHAGTYFGDFLPALSSGISDKAKIWAFEPNTENYRCARVTLALNDIRNVELMNAGLGADQKHLNLQTRDEKGRSLGGASRIVRDPGMARGLVEVPIVPLDAVVPPDRRVSIIQLDVEGHERQAMIGALKSIQRCMPIVILEVLPSSTFHASRWFSDNFLALGYRKSLEVHSNHVFRPA